MASPPRRRSLVETMVGGLRGHVRTPSDEENQLQQGDEAKDPNTDPLTAGPGAGEGTQSATGGSLSQPQQREEKPSLFYPPQDVPITENMEPLLLFGRDPYPKLDKRGRIVSSSATDDTGGKRPEYTALSREEEQQKELESLEVELFKSEGKIAASEGSQNRMEKMIMSLESQLEEATTERDQAQNRSMEIERENTKLRQEAERFPNIEATLGPHTPLAPRPRTPHTSRPHTPRTPIFNAEEQTLNPAMEGLDTHMNMAKAQIASLKLLRGEMAYKAARYGGAIMIALQALDLASECDRRDLCARAHYINGRAEYELEHWDAAADAFEMSMSILTDLKQDDPDITQWLEFAQNRAMGA